MLRIFSSLALSQLLVLFGGALLALAEDSAHAQRHVLAAAVAGILSCFIQTVVFTYLTLTGKLVAQAVHLGALDPSPLAQVKYLKRSCSYVLLAIVGSLVPTVATGANHWAGGHTYWLHVPFAVATLTAHGIGYYCQLDIIQRNAALVTRVLRAYDAKRATDRRQASTVHA